MFCFNFKICSILVLIENIFCANIDTEYPIIFSYDHKFRNDSNFGVSLSAIQESNSIPNSILIGAPKYYSDRNIRTGAIFHCQWTDRQSESDVICRDINNLGKVNEGMDLGSSLSANDNSFVGCGHRFHYQYLEQKYPLGKCYLINNQGIVDSEILIERMGNLFNDEGAPLYSQLMFGFSSSKKDRNSFLFGAPGFNNYAGKLYEGSRQYSGEQRLNANSYFGYALGRSDTNHFTLVSAPKTRFFDGRIYVYYDREYIIQTQLKGDSPGEYFGAVILAVDINGDKIDDIVVGAPLYSQSKSPEIGKIYIFLKKLNNQVIVGHKSYGRFGSALSSIDINNDQFKDVIIGAPFEKNSHSMGAVYIYLGSALGLILDGHHIRIGAEDVMRGPFNGFGISIVSSVDFDGNGYTDLLIGSYLSEKAVLLRSKPMADLSLTNISFKPNKISLKDKNLKIEVNYCVKYEGKYIRDKQLASVALEVTDSEIRVQENRALIKDKTKSIELRANNRNCFANKQSFILSMNEPDKLFDIITPIEIRITVQLKNQTSNTFCKDCAIAPTHSMTANIDFEHSCKSRNCLSRLGLSAVYKYGGDYIRQTIIEGIHDNIDLDIDVLNRGEVSLNTILIINMKPTRLELTKSGEAHRCSPINGTSYRCDLKRILQKNNRESLNLHFVVSRIQSNRLDIDLKVKSNSSIDPSSQLTDSIGFDIRRQANLKLESEPTNNTDSYSDKIKSLSFKVHYILVKSGSSTISTAHLIFRLPTDFIILVGKSQKLCKIISNGYQYKYKVVDNTLSLNCDQSPGYCSQYSCQLPTFDSGEYRGHFSLSLALIPSKVQHLVFKRINITLNSELKIENEVKYETDIKSKTSTTILMTRDVPIFDAKVEPWVLFVSSGFGIFILIIAIIVLIKIGFFRRKKLEEIQKIKQRMSMKPNIDINVNDINELNELPDEPDQ